MKDSNKSLLNETDNDYNPMVFLRYTKRNILPPSKQFYTSHVLALILPLFCNPLFSVLLTAWMPFFQINKA